MTKELFSVIHQNTLNDIIVKAIQKHHPKIGTYTGEAGDEELLPLPHNIVVSMNGVAQEISATVLALNEIFVSKNITAVSAEDYLEFLCDLLPKYISAPTSLVSKDEAEAAIILQVENTTISSMREAITLHNFASQTGDEKIGLELIQSQINEIDDGMIKEAYKTLLLNQLNVETQPQ